MPPSHRSHYQFGQSLLDLRVENAGPTLIQRWVNIICRQYVVSVNLDVEWRDSPLHPFRDKRATNKFWQIKKIFDAFSQCYLIFSGSVTFKIYWLYRPMMCKSYPGAGGTFLFAALHRPCNKTFSISARLPYSLSHCPTIPRLNSEWLSPIKIDTCPTFMDLNQGKCHKPELSTRAKDLRNLFSQV